MAIFLGIDVNIPARLGTITKSHKGSTGRGVILLQDAFVHLPAQLNNAHILIHLIENYRWDLICVEGGSRDDSLAYMREYADKERRKKVASEFLEAGKISFENYVDLVFDYSLRVWGVEKPEYYDANMEAFKAIQKVKEEKPIIEDLKEAEQRFRECLKDLVGQRMESLFALRKEVDDQKKTLASYYKELGTRVALMGRNRDAILMSPSGESSQMERFLHAAALEGELRFDTVQTQLIQAATSVSKRLPQNVQAALIGQIAQYASYGLRQQAWLCFHPFFSAWPNLQQQFPLAFKYLESLYLAASIDYSRLFEEGERLEQELRSTILEISSKASVAKGVARILDALVILRKMWNLRATPADYLAYKWFDVEGLYDFHELQRWVDSLTAHVKKPPTLTTGVSYALESRGIAARFCHMAYRRAIWMLRNLQARREQFKSNVAILIAGGFHTDVIRDRLRELDESYLVIAPHLIERKAGEPARQLGEPFDRQPMERETQEMNQALEKSWAKWERVVVETFVPMSQPQMQSAAIRSDERICSGTTDALEQAMSEGPQAVASGTSHAEAGSQLEERGFVTSNHTYETQQLFQARTEELAGLGATKQFDPILWVFDANWDKKLCVCFSFPVRPEPHRIVYSSANLVQQVQTDGDRQLYRLAMRALFIPSVFLGDQAELRRQFTDWLASGNEKHVPISDVWLDVNLLNSVIPDLPEPEWQISLMEWLLIAVIHYARRHAVYVAPTPAPEWVLRFAEQRKIHLMYVPLARFSADEIRRAQRYEMRLREREGELEIVNDPTRSPEEIAPTELSEQLQNPLFYAWELNNLGYTTIDLGDYAEARRLLEQSVLIFRNLQQTDSLNEEYKRGLCYALESLASLAIEEGNDDEAFNLLDESIKLARELTDERAIAIRLNDIAIIKKRQGDYVAARQHYEESEKILRQLDDSLWVSRLLANHAALAFAEGRHNDARTMYEESLHIKRGLGDERGIAYAQHGLAELECAEGKCGEAQRLYNDALQVGDQMKDKYLVSHCLHGLGDIGFKLKDYAAAEQQYRSSLRMSQEIRRAREAALSLGQLGLVFEANQEVDQAVVTLVVAARTLQKLKAPEAKRYREALQRLEQQVGTQRLSALRRTAERQTVWEAVDLVLED
ncbi:tetratricopeptide repeat protein [Candidatus Poribacteria bacterium]|nr:tetratricopeptide repeat protein [Candidatus Poribacteria bacterium]